MRLPLQAVPLAVQNFEIEALGWDVAIIGRFQLLDQALDPFVNRPQLPLLFKLLIGRVLVIASGHRVRILWRVFLWRYLHNL